MDCEVRPSAEGDKLELVLKLHLDSKMERELKREVNEGEHFTVGHCRWGEEQFTSSNLKQGGASVSTPSKLFKLQRC